MTYGARVWIASYVAMVALLWLHQNALGHDSWISRGAFRNSAGQWCCGQNDCAVMDEGSVATISGGYAVHGMATVRNNGAFIRWRIDETVPYSEAQPSPDGAYWICKLPDGTRRCFFAPPPNT
jgi:hypothetical protein